MVTPDVKKQFDTIFGGGRVERYHTRSTITTQSNAEHSFGVASIIALIDPNCSKELLLYALWHDVYEVYTGDIPASVKWRWPEIKRQLSVIEREIDEELQLLPKISEKERALLKMADNLETLVFCEKEQGMGNKSLDQIITNCVVNISEINKIFPHEKVMQMLFDRGLYR